MLKRLIIVLACVVGVLVLAAALWLRRNDQVADARFEPRVAQPAYAAGRGPRVCIDQAHHNVHTAAERYRPFAELLARDGYRVSALDERFTAAALTACDLLVIANALGARWVVLPGAGRAAFTPAERDAVHAWVERGGALLLVADHEPAGAAARALSERFGVAMSAGRTYDDPHSDWTSGSSSWLVFQRDTGARILDHPITRGRDSTERLRRVVTFTGQSLAGPPGSAGFLALADGARDRLPDGSDVPAAGRAQAVALTVGRGRVVVLGEAAVLTAQVTGAGARRFGMTWPNTDDRQLALNVAHWLSGALSDATTPGYSPAR